MKHPVVALLYVLIENTFEKMLSVLLLENIDVDDDDDLLPPPPTPSHFYKRYLLHKK